MAIPGWRNLSGARHRILAQGGIQGVVLVAHREVPLKTQATLPAATPEAQAHWKLCPPRWPVTSTTSPIKYRFGYSRTAMVLEDSWRVSTPPSVTSAVL